MQIDVRSSDLAPVYPAANVTTAGTSIANPADTFTDPIHATLGYIDMSAGGVLTSNGLILVPFGTDTATETFLMSIFAVDRIGSNGSGTKPSWTSYLLCSFTCTLASTAIPGLAGSTVPATGGVGGSPASGTQLYCGTIIGGGAAGGVGNTNISNEILSPTGNVKASILVDTKGARFVRILLAINASSVSANCLYRRV